MSHTKKFEDVSAQLGEFIFENKWKVAIVWFLLNGIFGLGLLSLKLNNDIESLYVNRHIPTKQLQDKLTELYPDTSDEQFSVYSSVKPPVFAEIIVSAKGHTNLFHPIYVNETKHLLERIMSIAIKSDYRGQITYKDVCAQTSNKCVIEGMEIIEELGDCLHKTSKCILNMSNVDRIIDNIGDYNGTSNVITEARYFRFKLFLRQDTPGLLLDSKRWQKSFLEYMSTFTNAYLEVLYSLSSSLLDELGEETYLDIRYFGLSFTILLTYMGFYISGGDCVSNKVNIGRMGTIVVPLSILGAWGLTCGIGVQFTNTVGVMPFVALYVELNNVLITMNNLANHGAKLNARDRISKALRTSCIPITVTTISYVAVFAVGTQSSFLAMEIVSKFTVITVMFIYVNHMIFFTACLAIHEQRIDANRHFCTCNTIPPKNALSRDKSWYIRFCCTGERPHSIEDISSNIEKLSQKFLSYFVLRSYVKLFVVCMIIIFLGGAIWQTTRLNIGIYRSDLLTNNSYHSKFMKAKTSVFGHKIYVMFVAPGCSLGSGSKSFNGMKRFINKITLNKYIDSNSVISWVDAYNEYINLQDAGLLFNSTFQGQINSFLSKYSNYQNDFVFDVDGTIISTRFYARTINIQSIDQIRDLKQSFLKLEGLSDSRKTFDEYILLSQRGPKTSKCNADDNNDTHVLTIHSPDFILIDEYYSPLIESLILISTMAVTSIILTSLVCPHPRYFLIHVSSFAAAVVCIFGIMSFSHVEITSVSMVLMVLGICYVADVCTHMVYSFHRISGTDRQSRANQLLSITSVIFLNSLLGSFLGLILLLFTQSYVFSAVMKILIICTAVSLILSAFVLPVVFSLLGPNKKPLLVTEIKFPDACNDTVGKDGISTPVSNKCNGEAENKIFMISHSTKM